MNDEEYKPKNALEDFLNILDKLEKEDRQFFLNGLYVAFFDPLGRRILKYLVEDGKID